MNDAHPGPVSSPGWGVLGILLLAFFTLGAGWSLTTAPGGAPDEIQHSFRAISVWNGQILAEPLPTGGATIEIPQSWTQIQDSISCFAGHGETAASCALWPTASGPEVPAGNSAGRYNPTYYLLVGLPFQLFAPQTALHLSRLLACLLTATLLTLAAGAMIIRGGSFMARTGLVAALTPMAVFLGSSVNPSGMEISGAIAGWVGLMYLARDPEHPARRYFAVVAGVGLCSLVVSRPASFLWLAVLGVVFLVAAGWRTMRILARQPAVLIAAGAVGVVTAGCLVWNRVAHTSDLSTGAAPFGGLWEGFVRTFRSSEAWWSQQIGVLGWLDTPLPTGVLWGTLLIIGVLVIPALVGAQPRMRLALLATVAAAVAVPILAQTALFPQAGLLWQGRYGMPLTVGVVIVAGIALDETAVFESAFARRLMTTCLAGWAVIGVTMGFYNLQRYATGSADNAEYGLLWRQTAWQPPGGNAFAVGLTAAGYVAVALALAGRGRRSTSSPTAPDSADQALDRKPAERTAGHNENTESTR